MASQFPHSRAEVLLKITGLSVVYDFPVLNNVEIEIRNIIRPGLTQGQKIALLAPSGMGKTQLFKRIAGLKSPTTGEILVGQEQVPSRRGMVGNVPQNYLLFAHRTVGKTLTLAAQQREHKPWWNFWTGASAETKEKVDHILEEFGLFDKKTCYPHQLSGGQKQRVSIAEQILSSSGFMLMDEPFSGLDIIAKKKVAEIIDNVSARDDLNTIIFSTHDIEAAVMLADTVLILGRDHDATTGEKIPGARVQKTIDLVDRNLAWHPDIDRRPGFFETVNEIKALFPHL